MDESPLSAHALSLSASTGGRGLTPGLTTVVLPPPQTRGPSENTPLTAAQQKKARDKEYQRRKRANAAQLRSQQQAAAAAAAAHREASVREASTDGGGDENASTGVGGRSSSRRPNKRPRPADDDWLAESPSPHGSIAAAHRLPTRCLGRWFEATTFSVIIALMNFAISSGSSCNRLYKETRMCVGGLCCSLICCSRTAHPVLLTTLSAELPDRGEIYGTLTIWSPCCIWMYVTVYFYSLVEQVYMLEVTEC